MSHILSVKRNIYLHGLNDCSMGLKRLFELVSALFSFTLRPPDSVVLRAPAFHGSGVMILSNFFSHFSQTILETIFRKFLFSFCFFDVFDYVVTVVLTA